MDLYSIDDVVCFNHDGYVFVGKIVQIISENSTYWYVIKYINRNFLEIIWRTHKDIAKSVLPATIFLSWVEHDLI